MCVERPEIEGVEAQGKFQGGGPALRITGQVARRTKMRVGDRKATIDFDCALIERGAGGRITTHHHGDAYKGQGGRVAWINREYALGGCLEA